MALWRSAVRSRLGPPDEPPPRAIARGFFFAPFPPHPGRSGAFHPADGPPSEAISIPTHYFVEFATANSANLRNWMLQRTDVTRDGTGWTVGRTFGRPDGARQKPALGRVSRAGPDPAGGGL